VLARRLGDTHAVLSLASPGWGLTQQIRRYYEVGRPLEPEFVVLQINSNDVSDSQNQPVTVVRNGCFVIRDLESRP
jgi:hypothetical protein